MRISKVSHSDYVSDVPVANLAQVLAIFWLFLSTKVPNDKRRLSERAMEFGGLNTLATNLPSDIQLEEIRNEILTTGSSKRSLDYDPYGVGKQYALRCCYDPQLPSGYLFKMLGGGDRWSTMIEQEIATVMGVDRDCHYLGAAIEVPSEDGESFRFDFEQVLRKVDPVLGTTTLNGEGVVAELMAQDTGGTPWAFLVRNEDYVVRLAPEYVGGRYDFSNGNGDDVWKAEGSILSGPLYRSARDRPFEVPEITIIIVPPHPGVSFRDPNLKQKVSRIAECLVTCFK